MVIKIVAIAIFFLFGGYVGYLDALVGLNEVKAEQELMARDGTYKVNQQLQQMEAMARVKEKFAQKNVKELSRLQQEEVALKQQGDGGSSFKSQLLAVEDEKKEAKSLFTEDAIAIAENLAQIELAKEVVSELEENKEVIREEPKSKKSLIGRIFDMLAQLKVTGLKSQLLTEDWLARPGTIPSSIRITVQDKTGRNQELEQLHVNQIAAALELMPDDFESRISSIIMVYGDDKMRRGVSGFRVMFMKGEERDIFSVVIHEFGHIYDLHQEERSGDPSPFHHGPYQIPSPDPTAEYYGYSWENDFNKLHDKMAYASGYGTSIPPEDFAETFALYVLQGETFRKWAGENEVIKAKYDFLKDTVYQGREFKSTYVVNDRPYDVTKLPYELSDLL